MTEAELIDQDGLFHNIVKASAIMQGRYALLPNGPLDLNAGNVLTGIELPKDKYPLVACLPPVSAVDSGNLSSGQWERLTMRLIFACKKGVSGDGQFKDRDPNTNTSLQRSANDWSDMKAVAFAFFHAFEGMERVLRGSARLDERSPLRISRFTNAQSDGISGVLVQFGMALATACLHTDINASDIAIPDSIQNPKFH